MMVVVNDGLFDLDTTTSQERPPTALMTDVQRGMIRDLFAQLGVTQARPQFDMVAELTGARITSVGQLEVSTANTLIKMLSARVDSAGRASTGNAWDDRDEDTWIDRL